MKRVVEINLINASTNVPVKAKNHPDFAIKLARRAGRRGEIPVAALVLHNDSVISAASNRVEELRDSSAHAEILALRLAHSRMGNERLEQCDLLVTLEPCTMCTGMAVQARIRKIFYLAREKKIPAAEKILTLDRHGHIPQLIYLSHYASKAEALMTDFFLALRQVR